MGIIHSRYSYCIDIGGGMIKFMKAGYKKSQRLIDVIKFGTLEIGQHESQTNSGRLLACDETVRTVYNIAKKEGMAGRSVYLSISDPSVILRAVKIPYMSAKSLKRHLELAITQYLPINTDEYIYDYKVTDIFEKDGNRMMSLLLTSISKEVILSYVLLFKETKMKLKAIDIYPNSVSRLFSGVKNADIAVIDINNKVLELMIIEKGKLLVYSNTVPVFQYRPGEGGAIPPAVFEQAADFIKTYASFFSSRHFGKSIDTVFVLGELSLEKGIDAYLKEQLQTEVLLGLPQSIRVRAPLSEEGLSAALETNKRISVYSANLGLVVRGEKIEA